NHSIQSERIFSIIKYIQSHLPDPNLSVQMIAEHFYLNPQYFSRYFKLEVGITVKRFIENLRLTRSIHTLKLTDETVLEVATKFGFPDAKSYFRVFKAHMGITPNAYRKINHIKAEKNTRQDYFSINTTDSLKTLFEYLEEVHTRPLERVPETELQLSEARKITIEYNNTESNMKGATFLKPWNRLMTFGYAAHGLEKEVQDVLKQVHDELGVQYVRFHGIFSDEMLSVHTDQNGKIRYDYKTIDSLLDQMIGIGVRPFMEVGFMPKHLVTGDFKFFKWGARIGKPLNLDDWTTFIQEFMEHLIDRYGMEEVTSWYFEFWNEPDIQGIFWIDDLEDFFELFKATYYVMKKISADLKVGGFGNMSFTIHNEWLDQMAIYLKKNQIQLDFFSFHTYPVEIRGGLDFQIDQNISDFLNGNGSEQIINKISLGDSNLTGELIDRTIERIESLGVLVKSEYWITEFNSSTLPNDLVHDTCFMTAFLVKNFLESRNKVSGIGFWTLTDHYDELEIDKSQYYGGFGLFARGGIAKAAYNSYWLLSKVHGKVVGEGPGYIVTISDDKYFILIYHYVHYNRLYQNMDVSQMDALNRYKVFDCHEKLKFNIKIEGLKGSFQEEIFTVNRKQGSSFDAWTEMGAPEDLSKEAVTHLKSKAFPGVRMKKIRLHGNYLNDISLDPHEVQVIVIEPHNENFEL
ncbi:MAG: helix-turn-helix domain-containing protein, partial [Bacillota bacterium]|nr:helix-turn-helix domain-containing protein [Bacillota bacterium]